MGEKKLVIDGLELHYEGLFDLDKLLEIIDKYVKERGYSTAEKRRHETVKTKSKQFSMELRPTKIKTEYYSLMIKIRINISNLKEVEVMKDDVKTKLHKGDITMLFDAWTTTDYKNRWENKPLYYFLLILVDKFIYKFHSGKFYGEVLEDTHYIYNNIKAHLNLHRY